MNVIIVNDFSYLNGGASKVAIDSALGLVRKVDKVVYFAAVGPAASEISSSEIDVICLGQADILTDSNRLRAAIQGLWNKQAAEKFKEALLQYSTHDTVIHIHSWTKALSSSVISQAIDLGFEVVITLHDYFTVCPNGGFYNYEKNEICTLKPLSRECISTQCDVRNYPQKLYRVGRQMIQSKKGQIPGNVKHYIYVSEFSKSILEPLLPKNSNYYLVNNPIVAKHYKPADISNNESFVMAGRLAPEKGPQLFLDAVHNLNASGILIGDGDWRPLDIEKYKSVEFTGWLSHEDLMTKISCAKALIFPSLLYETQGLTVLEAASLGVPAIVPDTCAARDMIIDGETGLIFKGGDLQDLQLKMMILMNDTEYLIKLGENAYEAFWKEPQTLDSHVKGLLSVYNKILNP